MKKLFILLLFIFPLLSGCSSFGEKIIINQINLIETYNSDVDYSTKNLKDYTVNVSSQNVYDLIVNKESFILLLGSESCSQCISMKPLLIRYILTSRAAMHYLDLDDENDYLVYQNKLIGLKDVNDKDIFTIEGTPIFYFFDKGKVRDELPKLKSYNAYRNLEAMLNMRIKVSSVIMLRNYEELVLVNRKSAKIIFYVMTDKVGQKVYQDMIITKNYQLYLFPVNFINLSITMLESFELSSIISTTLTKYINDKLTDEIVFAAIAMSQNMLDSFFAY